MEGRQGALAGAGMGADGRAADPRSLSQEEHLAPWMDRKDNRGLGFASASSMIQEAKSVKAQEVTMFELEARHISPNPKITELNQLIVKKLGALSTQRKEYLRAIACGATVTEKKMLTRNIRNLFSQIHKFQHAVRDLGGVYYQTPTEFNDVKDI